MAYNWTKILTYFLKHLNCTYDDLTKEFGVSSAAIKDYQRKNGVNWHELRIETIQVASKSLPQKVGEQIAEVKARHLQLSKMLQRDGAEVLQDQVDSKTGEVTKRVTVHQNFTHKEARESIKDGVKIERETLGLDKIAPGVVNNTQNNFLTVRDFNKIVAGEAEIVEDSKNGQPATVN